MVVLKTLGSKILKCSYFQQYIIIFNAKIERTKPPIYAQKLLQSTNQHTKPYEQYITPLIGSYVG